MIIKDARKIACVSFTRELSDEKEELQFVLTSVLELAGCILIKKIFLLRLNCVGMTLCCKSTNHVISLLYANRLTHKITIGENQLLIEFQQS